MMLSLALSVSLLLGSSIRALPVSEPSLAERASITTLSTAAVSAYKPFTYFASAAWCSPSTTLTWTCGANCNATSGFVPIASGGDGGSVQYWFVGFSSAQSSVIVSHQGTDSSKIASVATDLSAVLENLDSTLFPGISSSIKVHSGFKSAQAKTATTILAAVQKAISTYNAKKVTIVGHSLGAAIALLDGVYLPLHLTGVTVQTIGYGMPRVGNQEFADYVDAHTSFKLTRVNDKQDPVPIIPGRGLGYHHASGEVHIDTSSNWLSCPGQDNTSSQCSTGAVANLLVGKVADHMGPYDGVTMGC